MERDIESWRSLSRRKAKRGVGRLLAATSDALAGIASAARHETAFRHELLLAAVLLPVALWLDVTAVEHAVLIGTVFLVLAIELLNSGIEAAIDRISEERHPLSKRAKDMGSAAVLMSLLGLGTTWLLVAGPRLLDWLGR